MSCEAILRDLSFSCRRVSDGVLFVTSPLTVAGDGELIGAFVLSRHGSPYVTDNCSTLMNLSSRGIDMQSSRIRALKGLSVGMAEVSLAGEIFARPPVDNVGVGVADVCATALAVSQRGVEWLRASRNTEFELQVEDVLRRTAGSRVRRRVKLRGASGRQLEFPFVVEGRERLYIQPVAYGDHDVPAENVYRGLGKMTELALLDIPVEQRIVILQDVPDDESVSQAVTLLSTAATVLLFSRSRSWSSRFMN